MKNSLLSVGMMLSTQFVSGPVFAQGFLNPVLLDQSSTGLGCQILTDQVLRDAHNYLIQQNLTPTWEGPSIESCRANSKVIPGETYAFTVELTQPVEDGQVRCLSSLRASKSQEKTRQNELLIDVSLNGCMFYPNAK